MGSDDVQPSSNLVRKDLVAVFLIFFLALMIRSIALGAESFWIDEIMTSTRSRWSFMEVMRSIGERDHMPLYYVIMMGWSKLFGSTEIGLRSFSVLVGSLSIVPIYLIGRRSSFRNGLLIGAVACFLPVQVYFSQEAKMYSLIIFLSSISIFTLMEYMKPILIPTKKISGWILLITNILLAYTHYYSYLLILAELILIVYLQMRENEKYNWRSIAKIGHPTFIPLASGSLWVLYLAYEGVLFDQTTGGGISLSAWGLLSIYPFLAGSYVVPDKVRYIPMVLASLFMLSAMVIGFMGKKGKDDRELSGRSFAFFFLIMIPVFALLLSITIMNIYGQRYFLILSPVILFLTIYPIERVKLRKIRNLLLLLVIAASILALPVQYSQAEKDDWRGAVSYVKENEEDIDIVIPVPFWERRSISYYGPELEIVYGTDEQELDEKIEGCSRIWVVIKDYKDDDWTLEHVESLYGPASIEKEFTGLTLYLFEM